MDLNMMRRVALVLVLLPGTGLAQTIDAEPLDVARVFAATYPESTSMSYTSALSWSGALRLYGLTGEPSAGAAGAIAQLSAYRDGLRPALAPPYRLTSLAGLSAIADLVAGGPNWIDDSPERSGALLDEAVGLLLAPPDGGDAIPYATGWTDDMYMVTSLLARFAQVTPSADDSARAQALIGRLLLTYSERLQRPDGLFIHAETGPFAWGRGNGFAALGVTEALMRLPESWSDREAVLEIYRRHMDALVSHQTDDGSWRQVVDQDEAYRELTVTAMTVMAMARGVRHGWLDADRFASVIERGWEAILARIEMDGTVRDACASTPAGTTLEFYLDRPVVNGADDRAGGLVLVVAIEMEELQRALAAR